VLGDVECKIQANIVNARIKKFTKNFAKALCHVGRSETSLADLGAPPDRVIRDSSLRSESQEEYASDHPELHSTGLAISIEYHGVLLVAAPLAQLEKSAGLFVDLAHRN
jgi:hypothetical protein